MKTNNIPWSFLWGASTSAYQVEGGYNANGKGLSIQDIKDKNSGIANFEIASDHYHRFKEDVALMAELGLKSYRFSVSWARIFPNGFGEVNKKGIAFYNELINELLKYCIEPILTIYHFDLPLELEKLGGWNNKKVTIEAFLNYAKVLFESFGDRVKYWLTINEQNMLILAGNAIGVSNRKNGNSWKELYQQNHYMTLAQAKVIKLCHKMLPNAKIGPAPNISYAYAATCNPEDKIAELNANALRNWLYLDLTVKGEYNPIVWRYFKENNYTPKISKSDMKIIKSGKPDFIAFNYYSSLTVKKSSYTKEDNINKKTDQHIYNDCYGMYDVQKNDYLTSNNYGWTIDPVGLRVTARNLYERYGLPLIITENGLGAEDVLTSNNEIYDTYRIDYLRSHIEQIKEIINDGVELFGYCPWSAVDLVSTHQGFSKRYGFVYVNRGEKNFKDLKRYKKASFYWYKKVISSNGNNL